MLPETDESVFPGGAPISPIAITCAAFLLLHASDLPHVSKPQGHTTSLLSGLNSSPPVSPTLPPLPSLTSQADSSLIPHRPQCSGSSWTCATFEKWERVRCTCHCVCVWNIIRLHTEPKLGASQLSSRGIQGHDDLVPLLNQKSSDRCTCKEQTCMWP